MIGDKLIDVETGINAGCKNSFLVLTGHGMEYKDISLQNNILVYNNLYKAIESLKND